MRLLNFIISEKSWRSPIISEKSWHSGEIACHWKRGNITDTSKRGKNEGLQNRRVVSLTSASGKIIEQILLETTLRHREERDVIRDRQRGFTLTSLTSTNAPK